LLIAFYLTVSAMILFNRRHFFFAFADWACLDEVVGDGGVVLVDGRGPGQVLAARGEGHDERLTRNTRYV
jgi:hypothetical protein